MKKIRNLLFTFVCVTTCVVFVTAVYITIFYPKEILLETKILWQILLVSFLCSLGVFIYPDCAISRKAVVFLTGLHYIEVNVVVLGCGLWFQWFYADNLPMVLGMVIMVALVFLLVTAVLWNRDKRMAIRMNERLRAYQQENSQAGMAE